MGLSLTQILFTVAVVLAVWRVVGFFERRRKLKQPARKDDRAVAVEPCPRCGAYVARGLPCPNCTGDGPAAG